MEIKKQFMSVWKSHSNVLSISLYSLILVVVEGIMELEFKCPQKKPLRVLYILSYFLCPAFITFFMSLSSDPTCILRARYVGKCSCCRNTQGIFRVFLPPVIWCLILLCDGRYIDCLVSTNERNSDQSTTQDRAAELPSEPYTISQVAGLFTLTAVVILCSLCHIFPHWFCCKGKEKYEREELQSRLEEGAWNYLEELKKEGAEMIMEEKVKPSLQPVNGNFWENLDLKNTAKKIKEVVESAVRDMWKERQQAEEHSVALTSLRH